MFSPLSSPCVQLSSPRCTCGSPALLHTHTYSHPPTNTHTLALHASSLTETYGAKVSSAPRDRETAPSLPFPACFSSTAAAFPFPFSPPLRPRSPRASQAGRGGGGPLTSAPLRRGPALGSPYPQLLLVRSAGREGWRGPADSSQMLAKCSYVITVFSILPPRPLCVSFPPPLHPQLWPVSDLALPPSLHPPTPHNITICSAQQLIPSEAKFGLLATAAATLGKRAHVFQELGSDGQHCSVLASSPSLPHSCRVPLLYPSLVPANGERDT